MSIRSQARDWLIQAATLVRADELGLRMHHRRRPPRGLIVGMHETPVALESQFRAQLGWVSRHFTITDLETFASLWKGSPGSNSKPPILFTFDDGRESNYTVAAPILESFGGRGVFFIVPSFAECPADAALGFYRTKINLNSRPGDEQWEDWKPMSPRQIGELADRGHAIGNHTLTHRRLVRLSPEELEHEIGDSARQLASWTRKPVEAFAWTFGWDGIDANAWELVKRYHRFCFSPCAGAIDPGRDTPNLLWRREIEVKYSPAEYRFFYSGLVDPWWSGRRKRLRNMLGISTEAVE